MRWRIAKRDGLWNATNAATGLSLWFPNPRTAYGFLEGLERSR